MVGLFFKPRAFEWAALWMHAVSYNSGPAEITRGCAGQRGFRRSSFPLVYMRHLDSWQLCNRILEKGSQIWTESEKFNALFSLFFLNYRLHEPRVWCPLEANKVFLIAFRNLKPPITFTQTCTSWVNVAICSTSCAKHANKVFGILFYFIVL